MIELRDVDFAYSKCGFALRIDQLSVREGQQECWIGPSGCGKTTLLHLVAGIFSPDSGYIKTCGEELHVMSDAARREFRIANIGLVFQDFALLDYLNVLDNILLPYRISRALRLNSEACDRAAETAGTLGLGGKLGRRPNQLSQGEQQRVAICRAMVTSPRLLLADEPTANLDQQNATRVLDALQAYASEHKAAMAIVSHDRDTISRIEKKRDVGEFCVQTQLAEARGGSGA